MTDRVRLNLRVSRKAKAEYEDAIRGKFGTVRPYAGVRLEDEFRARLDDGELSELQTAIDEAADVHGIADRDKKFSAPQRADAETTVVSYRVAEDVRTEIISLARAESWRSPGDYVESIMRCYAETGSIVERSAERATRVAASSKRLVDDSLSATERRARNIADYLEHQGGDSFTLEAFDEAVETAARGLSSGRHARTQYLRRVLEILDYTWHPKQRDVFTDSDVLDLADQRDVRHKPYHLMNEDDRLLAVKTQALASASRASDSFTTEEALDVLEGKPQRKTINGILRELGSTADGFRYSENSAGEKMLKIDRPDAIDGNPTAARLAGYADTGDDPVEADTSEPAADPLERWAEDAAAAVPDALGAEAPDPVLNNKIVRARWPDRLVDGGITDDTEHLLEEVTAADRERVRSLLDDDGPPTDSAAGEDDEKPPDVSAELERLEKADPVATDGGRR